MKIVKFKKKIQILIKKHFLFFLSIFFVFCLIALFLRWPGTFRGVDSQEYVSYFSFIHENSITYFSYLKTYWWLGSIIFLSINYLIHFITNDPSTYLYLMTGLIIWSFLLSYNKFFGKNEKKLFVLSLIMLLTTSTFYFFSLNVLRQGLLMPILIFQSSI